MSLSDDLRRVTTAEHVLWTEARRKLDDLERARSEKWRKVLRESTDEVGADLKGYKAEIDAVGKWSRVEVQKIEAERDARIAAIQKSRKARCDKVEEALDKRKVQELAEYEAAKAKIDGGLAVALAPLQAQRRELDAKINKGRKFDMGTDKTPPDGVAALPLVDSVKK